MLKVSIEPSLVFALTVLFDIQLAVLSVLIGFCAAYSKGYSSIELPIKSKHDLEIIKTPSHQEDSSTYVEVPGGVLPVYMSFKTQSSPLYVKQEHRGTKGSYQKSDSKDEPHRLVHEVVKPVIQELKEIITPYRKVIQVIEPVREERLTKVHKSEGKSGYGGDEGGYGGSLGGGYGGEDNKGYGKQEIEYKQNDYKQEEYKGMSLGQY